jgi:short-subunit dehydrogenase
MDWHQEVLLITGASSGLGRAIAIRTAQLGAKVILTARDEARLAAVGSEIAIAGGTSHLFPYDLVDVEGIASFCRHVQGETGLQPTMLFNVAGYNAAGFVQNTPVAVYERNYRVNVMAPVALIQALIPGMLEQNKGLIINVMSAAMYHAFPGMSSYGSSKAALRAIHQSLKAELVGLPVRTLYVEPGGFESGYWRNLREASEDRLGGFTFSQHRKDRPAQEVASRICAAIERGRQTFVLEGLMDKIGYHLNYWAPWLVDRLIAKRNHLLISHRPRG